jgi:PIN domain nuclease of toxin-antitoxin system
MKFLLDTHFLIWIAYEPHKLSVGEKDVILDKKNEMIFSTISIWEIIIKNSKNQDSFYHAAAALRTGLLLNGYKELPVFGRHTLELQYLQERHKDPFDRMLMAQARSDGLILLTRDRIILEYGSPAKSL